MCGLIGLDWGSSSLRAYRFDAHGIVRETRHRPWGVAQLPAGGFETALADISSGWPSLPRLACGMVGSRQGWQEMPYLELPTDAPRFARAIGRLAMLDGSALHLAAGLRNPGTADVMRGEETQVFGALGLYPELAAESEWILPGTHCKWVRVKDGRIVEFHTFMTGELHALLLRHSLLATGRTATPHVAGAFERGVTSARDSGAEGVFARLFSTRALRLAGQLADAEVASYLSGLLIGEEFRAGLAAGRLRATAPCLIGEAALCQRYRQAARLFDLHLPEPLLEASAHGLWLLAHHAGLLSAGAPLTPKEPFSC
ncbi:2-keto-3-deoxy-galactonokinase [Streptococcus dysgalactiae subsp. equisimilis]|nr:2-keto-3-deoxy-galactonokinase [Pseudomonas aeruginosa]VTS61089.1 2-keto-3-deoxy-galactonokinase [Streptococcus dysgalactiae subsp. equisimilis]